MWKLLLGFVVFAVAAVFMLMQGGDIDMGGENHGAINAHSEDTSAAPVAPVPAASR